MDNGDPQHKAPESLKEPHESAGDRFIKTMSRFIVSLMWCLLFAVFAFVFYLISR